MEVKRLLPFNKPARGVEAGGHCRPGAAWPGAGKVLDEAVAALPGLREEGSIRARGQHGGGAFPQGGGGGHVRS